MPLNNRTKYQGVTNIIRFNWHFYVLGAVTILFFFLIKPYLPFWLQQIGIWGIVVAVLTIIISLAISFYIYDRSTLYRLNWLDNNLTNDQPRILTVNAGFDETSALIAAKYPKAQITICDFYNPVHHTEISIKRARKAYPPDPGTIAVNTERLPFPDNHFDKTVAVLSAHEIRNEAERIVFFKELKRVTTASGHIYVTEHLRDRYNFFAYTIGFLHFHGKKTWLNTFTGAGLVVQQEIKTTPFITTFILQAHGNTL